MARRPVGRPWLPIAIVLAALLLALPALAAKGRKPAKRAPETPPAPAVVHTPESLAVAAAASPLHPFKAFPEFEALALGKDMDALTDYMRQRVDREVRPKMLATPDVRQRDKLQAEAAKQVEDFSLSHVEFRGQPTGWDVSILSGEFRHNARQEMRRHTAGETHAYFLLSEGTLWKLVRQSPAAERPFDQLVAQLRAAYGVPTSVESRTEYREGEPIEVPERAIWRDGTLTVQAVDMGTLYGAHVVKWDVAAIEQRVATMGTAGPRVDIKQHFRTEDVLRQVTTPSDRSVDDIVDRLLQGTAEKEAPKSDPQPK